MEALKGNDPQTMAAVVGTVSDVRARIQALIQAGECSQAEVSRQTGVSGGAISRWLNGKYDGDQAAIAERLQRWLDSRDRQAGFLMPEAPAYIPTRTSARIEKVLGYAQMGGTLALVYGGAGVGKTTTIRHYAETRPSVWVTRMSPATSSVAACLEALLHAVGIRGAAAAGSAGRMQRALIERMTGSRGLLIVDEAQHLGLPALETLRAIHDETRVGLVLSGNEVVYSRLTGGGELALFAQLLSRVAKRLSLGRPPADDVKALAAAYSVSASEALDLLQAVGRSPGALRGVVMVLSLASMLASGAGEALAPAHIKTAWDELGGAQ